METELVTAIVVKATDYREYDKLLRLFTAEEGMVTAVIKGVKKPKAKLKFAAQPFSVNQYALVRKNGYRTVTECAPLESLYEITYDPDSYTAGAVMLEVTDKAVGEISSPETFVTLLKALKCIALTGVPAYHALTKYLQDLLRIMGYGIDYTSEPFTSIAASAYDALGTVETSAAVRAAKKLLSVCEERFFCTLVSAGQLPGGTRK